MPPADFASLDDPTVVETLCDRIASGLGVSEVCEASDMPGETTVYIRMANDEAFRSRIARAREAQQEHEIDRTVAMADAATIEDHQVVKLRIWARQWRASKLAPKKYGDRTVIAGDKDAPLAVADVTDLERAKAVAALVAAAQRGDKP